MSQLLQSFIKRLQDATISLSATSGLGPGVEEFADMLWLAQYLPHKSKQQPKFWLLLLTMNCLAAIPFLRESPRPEPEPESPPDPQSPTEPGTLIDRPERITESQRKSQVKPLLVPAAAALRHPRQLARALRPLARKIDSRTEQVIDEEATAIAIAEKSFVGIVQKPASERWLELELVIEQSRIGAIWSRTCKEFIELLKRLGAFRVIRVWTLETSITEDEQHQPLLSAGLRSSNNRAMRCGQPNELLDSTGRRLVMVLSDCISPLWREGLIHDWLARWAKNGPAVIVQWFPTRYWSRTGLRAGDEVWLSALNPGTASDRLIRHYVGINPEEFQDFLAQLAEPQENFKTTSVVIPVVTLEPDSLEDWARVVVGSGDNQVVGRRFELRAVGEQWVGPLQPPRPLPKSGEERVRVFYETASDIAQELAGLMSLGPVSPEITNLIQETLLPESGAVHVAEVFLTGLLKEKSSQNYRFVPGAKELIQKSMTKIDRELVHQTLSNYVSDRYGHTPREFQAFLVRHDDWSEEQWQAVQGFAELKKPLSLKEITLIEQHHSELSRQSSRYQSYKDLSDREQEGTDYRIDYHQGISDAVIIAPHGGKIE
nr:SAV_2336 N-terminal domain-related protein [Xenococcus sp. MO_188.B8]